MHENTRESVREISGQVTIDRKVGDREQDHEFAGNALYYRFAVLITYLSSSHVYGAAY